MAVGKPSGAELTPSGDQRSAFGRVAQLAAGRPYATLGAVVAGVLLALWFALGLGVQSSRHALVSADHPYQSRLLSLVDDFGLPDDLIFWVEGGEPKQRRQAVVQLSKALAGNPALSRAQVTGPPRVESWAPIFAAQNSPRLAEILQGLGSQAQVNKALQEGLLGMIDRSYAQMSDPAAQGALDPKQLARTGQLIAALESLMKGVPLTEISAGLIQQGAKQDDAPGMVPLDEAGFLRSDDGSALLLVLSQVLANDEGDAMDKVVQAAREVQSQVQESVGSEVRIQLSGYPVLQVDEQAAIAQGLIESSLATGLGIILVLGLAFSSLRKSLIALIPLGVGAALSMGALYLLFGQVNAITSSFLAVLLGLGIDISVHLLARVDEGLAQPGKRDRISVLGQAFASAGPAVLVGTITTATAFMLLFGAEFQAYGELGLITAVGLMLMLGAAFLVIPALLVVWPGGERASSARVKGEQGLGRVARAILRRRGSILVLSLLAALVGAYLSTGIRFNPRYFDFMPGSLQSVALLERLEAESVASPLVVSVRASSLEDASAKAQALRAKDTVSAVQSPSDLLSDAKTDFKTLQALAAWWPAPPSQAAPSQDPKALATGLVQRAQDFVDLIDEQLFALSMQRSKQQAQLKTTLESWKAHWERIGALAKDNPQSALDLQAADLQVRRIRDSIGQLLHAPSVREGRWRLGELVGEGAGEGAGDLARRFMAKDPKQGLRLLVTPAGDFWAPGQAERFLQDIESVDPRSAGHSMSVIVHSSMIRRDFFRASGWALLAIAVVLLLKFRSLRSVLMVIVPLAVGWCWMLGVYALLGLSLNAANIVVLPLVLGIGVDAGVHLLHRVHEEESGEPGIVKAVAATGSAITICSLTTMVGFAGLMVAQYGGMKSLGLSMVIGIFTTWLATVVVMPALLARFPRR